MRGRTSAIDTRSPESRALDVHGMVKPLLRGRIHLAALVCAIPAGVMLVRDAEGPVPRTGATVYATSLAALFAASAAYHRFGCGQAARWLRRLDHSAIYVLIAGSYTPLCLAALDGAWRWSLLIAVWLAAMAGIVVKLVAFDAARVLGSALYIAMGWAVVVAAPVLWARLQPTTLGLLAAGGLVYTSGAVVLARRRPNPFPRVFGYHEVWHVMVVVAGAMHYAAIRQLL